MTVQTGSFHAEIGRGLYVLLAVEEGDGTEQADWTARKLAQLRIFPDEQNKMNRSLEDIRGAVLLVSQITLVGDTSRGNRPSFAAAAEPQEGRRLYERVAETLAGRQGLTVRTGIFGAAMIVRVVNDGPVTLIVRTKKRGSGIGVRGSGSIS